MGDEMRLALGCILAIGLHAQTPPPTRVVKLTWNPSTAAIVLMYPVYRCTEPCILLPGILGQPITFSYSTVAYDDAAVVGKTYLYGVTAVGFPCPATLVGELCGESVPATSRITIVPK